MARSRWRASPISICAAPTTDPAAAYFVTPTRAWEFAAGGLLAAAPATAARAAGASRGSGSRRSRSPARSTRRPRRSPGIAAALPVAGRARRDLGRASRSCAPHRCCSSATSRTRSTCGTGRCSTLAPYATGRPVDTTTTLTVLMLTLLLAWLTKLLHRRPHPAPRVRAPRWTFACAGAATAPVLAVAASGSAQLRDDVRAAETRLAAAARLPARRASPPRRATRERPCENPKLRLTVVPSPIEAHKQRNAPCPKLELPRAAVRVRLRRRAVARRRRRSRSSATATPPTGGRRVDVVAARTSWAGVSISHTGCPLSKATKNLPQPRRTQCVRWNQQVLRWFARHPEVTTVFVSQISGGAGVIAPGRDQLAAQRAGYLARLEGAARVGRARSSSCATRRRSSATPTPASRRRSSRHRPAGPRLRRAAPVGAERGLGGGRGGACARRARASSTSRASSATARAATRCRRRAGLQGPEPHDRDVLASLGAVPAACARPPTDDGQRRSRESGILLRALLVGRTMKTSFNRHEVSPMHNRALSALVAALAGLRWPPRPRSRARTTTATTTIRPPQVQNLPAPAGGAPAGRRAAASPPGSAEPPTDGTTAGAARPRLRRPAADGRRRRGRDAPALVVISRAALAVAVAVAMAVAGCGSGGDSESLPLLPARERPAATVTATATPAPATPSRRPSVASRPRCAS